MTVRERDKLPNSPNRERIALAWGAMREADRGQPGVDNFLDLTDTPASYGDHQHELVRVNSDETALEFVNFPGFGLTYTITLTTILLMLLTASAVIRNDSYAVDLFAPSYQIRHDGYHVIEPSSGIGMDRYAIYLIEPTATVVSFELN